MTLWHWLPQQSHVMLQPMPKFTVWVVSWSESILPPRNPTPPADHSESSLNG